MRKKSVVAIVAVVTALILVWAGYSVWEYGRKYYWWGTSDAQAVLEADPMVAEEFEGLTLVHSERPKREIFQFKSPAPDVSNWFKSDNDSEDAFDLLVSLAKSHGWNEVYGLNNGEGVWVGAKDSSKGSEMRIIINKKEEIVVDDVWDTKESVAVFIFYR